MLRDSSAGQKWGTVCCMVVMGPIPTSIRRPLTEHDGCNGKSATADDNLGLWCKEPQENVLASNRWCPCRKCPNMVAERSRCPPKIDRSFFLENFAVWGGLPTGG